jgi:hypothetical protein
MACTDIGADFHIHNHTMKIEYRTILRSSWHTIHRILGGSQRFVDARALATESQCQELSLRIIKCTP